MEPSDIFLLLLCSPVDYVYWIHISRHTLLNTNLNPKNAPKLETKKVGKGKYLDWCSDRGGVKGNYVELSSLAFERPSLKPYWHFTDVKIVSRDDENKYKDIHSRVSSDVSSRHDNRQNRYLEQRDIKGKFLCLVEFLKKTIPKMTAKRDSL